MGADNGSANFEKEWLRQSESHEESDDIVAIRDYAYKAFDKLDKNGNGFIERSELQLAQISPDHDNREKSFITFLLNNQEAIAQMVQEDNAGPSLGISRDDLESYFGLITRLLAM